MSALKALYDRALEFGYDSIYPVGYKRRFVTHYISISRDGSAVLLPYADDTHRTIGQLLDVKWFGLPFQKSRTSGAKPHPFWDKYEFVLGRESGAQRFADRVRHYGDLSKAEPIQACVNLINNLDLMNDLRRQAVAAGLTKIHIIALVYEGNVVARHPEVQSIFAEYLKEDSPEGFCMVTGKPDNIVRLSSVTVPELGGTPVSIINFNHANFESFGKEQAFNAPVGLKADTLMAASIESLMRSKGHVVRLEAETLIHWVDGDEAQLLLNNRVFDPFLPKTSTDTGDSESKALTESFLAPLKGSRITQRNDIRHHCLLISVSTGRLSILDYSVKPYGEIVNSLLEFYECVKCKKADGGFFMPSLWSMADSLLDEGMKDMQTRKKRITATITDLYYHVLFNRPLPIYILNTLVLRDKATAGPYRTRSSPRDEISFPRLALAKLIMKQLPRTPEGDMCRLLGKLLKYYEIAQKEANPSRQINASVTSRYYGAALSTPSSVFASLGERFHHNTTRMRQLGRHSTCNFLEKSVGAALKARTEIGEIPVRMPLAARCEFAVGIAEASEEWGSYLELKKKEREEREKQSGNDQPQV